MNRTLCLLILTVGVLTLLPACKEEGWTDADQQFIEVYTEILIVREHYPDTAVANPRVRKILQTNGYTMAEFRHAFEALTQKPERFKLALDSARAYARRAEKLAGTAEAAKTDSNASPQEPLSP